MNSAVRSVIDTAGKEDFFVASMPSYDEDKSGKALATRAAVVDQNIGEKNPCPHYVIYALIYICVAIRNRNSITAHPIQMMILVLSTFLRLFYQGFLVHW